MPTMTYEQILPFMVRVSVNEAGTVIETSLRLQASELVLVNKGEVNVDLALMELIAKTILPEEGSK